MKENVFNPDQMAVIISSLIYTHVRKLKAVRKQRELLEKGETTRERLTQLEKIASETIALIRHISENTDQEVRDFIHEQLKAALA